ncbi:MAG: hypothetical protein GY711_31560 [bacterium]|nr:hypothetical protein [bacterium]
MSSKTLRLSCLVASLFVAAPATALEAQDVEEAVREWRTDHGSGWRVRTHRANGAVEFLYGSAAPAPFRPNANRAVDWYALARHWSLETAGLHGVDVGQLVREDVVFLPLGTGAGTDKYAVSFVQEIDGLRVEDAGLNLLFDTNGRLLAVQSTGVPALAPQTTAAQVAPADAAAAARRAFVDQIGIQPNHVGAPELLFARYEVAGRQTARLAWHVDVAFEVPDAEPRGWKYTIDAASGNVVGRRTNVHYADVTGRVETMASPGTLPDNGSNPEQPLAAGYVRIDSTAGSVFADRDGNFTIPGTNGPLDVTVAYLGRFNDVNNQGGSDYTVTFPGLTSGQTHNLLMNPGTSEFDTGQANAYVHIGIVRDFIRDTFPGDSTADFVAVSRPNLPQSCNAFFNGSSVNYFRSSGGCVNTAYSTVVAHEFGHWLNVRYGTGNGGDGMGEGNADTWSMYTYDDPIVGEDFFNSGGDIRNGNNNRQYCGDGNGGCYGEVHADGEVWMGAAWKVRTNLKNSLGSTLGQATADGLFMGWLNAFDQRQIDSVIELQWLVLDDDDGNVNNGSPNYAAIDAGFQTQGFPGFELAGIEYAFAPLTDTTDEFGPYQVAIDVTSTLGATITGVELSYHVGEADPLTVAMTNVSGDTWQAPIPGEPSPAIIGYSFAATDSAGRSNAWPALAPVDEFGFNVGVLDTFLSYDFEAGSDEGWTVGILNDSATAGLWERGDPAGTIAQPEDDHTPGGTNCWFTGQGAPGGNPDDADVDGGQTTLVSPPFDTRGFLAPRIRYWQWYSNGEGAAPNLDSAWIDISRNNGASWVLAGRVGPFGPEATPGWRLNEVPITGPTAIAGRVRFRAQDFADDSLIELAIDDLEGVGVRSSCDEPQRYCQTAPNSVGPGAVVEAFGSQSVSADQLYLVGSGLPPFQFGLFYYGATQAMTPIGNGFVCVGSPLYRLPAGQVTDIGVLVHQLDFSSPPEPAAQITPGSTWNFGLWYRDPAGGGAGFNFSDAISIQFCR